MIEQAERSPDKSSDLIEYVTERLPTNYLLTLQDVRWLAVCNEFLDGAVTNQSVLEATKRACDVHGCKIHIDPFELLIDAGICDRKCQLKT